MRRIMFVMSATLFSGCMGAAEPLDTAAPESRSPEVGLAPDEAPCGPDEQIASVVDGQRRLTAFCREADGKIAVVQTAPDTLPLMELGGRDPLADFLAVTPEDVEVPPALARPGADLRGRPVAAGPVAFVAPAGSSLGTPPIAGQSVCTSEVSFLTTYCPIISGWANGPGIADSSAYCSSGLTNANISHTASTDGVPGAFEGRVIVAACGGASTTLRRYVKGGLSGSWVQVGSNVIPSGTVLSRSVYMYNLIERDPWLTPYNGTDLRFRVEPASGAFHRNTGGFVRYVPVT
jgi:hypothetical protein